MSYIPSKPPSTDLSFSQYVAIFEKGDPSKLSPETREYSQELIRQVSNEQMAKIFMRFLKENPSVQLVSPNDLWFKLLRQWMELSQSWEGEVKRSLLRNEIRKKFPLLQRHFVQWMAEADISIRTIEDAGFNLNESALAFVIQNAYLSIRWLDDPTVPEMPTASHLSRADGIAAMMKLRNWFHKKSLEPETQSPPPVAPIPPVAELLDNRLSAVSRDVKDEKGLISNPGDVAAYREAAKIIADFPDFAKDIKVLNRILEQHPEIRRWKPRLNRLSIHLGDWQRYVDSQSSNEWGNDPKDIQRRKREIRERNEGK